MQNNAEITLKDKRAIEPENLNTDYVHFYPLGIKEQGA